MTSSMLTNFKPENPLPTGNSSFEGLIEQDQIYIDKTALIYELLKSGQKLFLTRPRRFGKTVLLSTLESLFRHGLRYFGGLAIEKLWKGGPAKTVIRLDFSEIKGFRNADEFSEFFDDYLADTLLQEKLISELPPAGMGFRTFARCLKSQPIASTVILIDEYDTPLTECLDRPELFSEVRLILSRFYALLKHADRAIRFLFITGITKFTKASIFSELNNLTDVSLWPEFGTLLGYTEKEIIQYFPKQLSCASKALGLDTASLLQEMRKNYDGYCFDSNNATHVYVPWSVLNFLNHPQYGFKNYWLESGGQARILKKYFCTHELRSPSSLVSEKCVRLDKLSSVSDLETLDDLVLLYQAGYLTIKRVEDDDVFLGYPNLEVKVSMAQFYTDEMLGGKGLTTVGANKLDRQFATEKPEGIVHLFNRLFASTDYRFFQEIKESDVQTILFAYLVGGGLDPDIERHGSRGRSDLEVVSGGRAWIFEIKVQREGESAEKKLEEALSQIASRGYGEDRNPDTQEVIRMGFVFSTESRRITKWGLAPAIGPA